METKLAELQKDVEKNNTVLPVVAVTAVTVVVAMVGTTAKVLKITTLP